MKRLTILLLIVGCNKSTEPEYEIIPSLYYRCGWEGIGEALALCDSNGYSYHLPYLSESGCEDECTGYRYTAWEKGTIAWDTLAALCDSESIVNYSKYIGAQWDSLFEAICISDDSIAYVRNVIRGAVTDSTIKFCTTYTDSTCVLEI